MSPARIKVLFIAAWGRSGSTLLDILLGQFPGFFSAGEVRYIWDRGWLENRPCGCGHDFNSCPIWRQVTAASALPTEVVAEMARLRDAFPSRSCLYDLLPLGRRHLARRLRPYAEALGNVYRAIQETTGARVIIDSSKFPAHGYVLSLLPDIELSVVHLVRDPRAVAFSWQRRKLYDEAAVGPRYIDRHSNQRSTIYWLVWNLMIQLLWRGSARPGAYHLQRYEDLIHNPAGELERLVAMVGEPPDADFFTSSHRVRLAGNHMVAGNPIRFTSGELSLTEDSQWRQDMPRAKTSLVTLLAAPLLSAYGYAGRNRKG